ncbi:hypothetical protein Dsin_022686, partial [Dipteronia sinensis]
FRGFLLHFSVSYTARAALGLTFQWIAPLVFITIKASVFVLVMSFVKDLSNVEGDLKHQISTLAIKFGVRNIALLDSGILLVKYIVGVLWASIYMPQVVKCEIPDKAGAHYSQESEHPSIKEYTSRCSRLGELCSITIICNIILEIVRIDELKNKKNLISAAAKLL